MLAMGMMLGGLPVYDITLSSNRAQWQRSVDAPQIPSGVPVTLILRISSAIEIQSTSTSIAAIHVDSLAPGSQFVLINQGYAIGKGGNGGTGSDGGANGFAGSAAGDAVRLDFTGVAQITNSAGRIWGGGGGGGGGGANSGTGGGGGGGAGGSTGGSGGSGASAGGSGSSGSAGTAGAGGAGSGGGAGGNGGAYGADGSNGSGSGGFIGGNGGAAGYAIRHNAGTTVSFVSGSGSPNVKGTVGS